MNSSEDGRKLEEQEQEQEQEIKTKKEKLIENMIRDEPKLTQEEEAARQKQKKADY